MYSQLAGWGFRWKGAELKSAAGNGQTLLQHFLSVVTVCLESKGFLKLQCLPHMEELL